MVEERRNRGGFMNIFKVEDAYKHVLEAAENLKSIYTAPTDESGLEALGHFEEVWGTKFPYIVKS